jgi:hypothetical protein
MAQLEIPDTEVRTWRGLRAPWVWLEVCLLRAGFDPARPVMQSYDPARAVTRFWQDEPSHAEVIRTRVEARFASWESRPRERFHDLPADHVEAFLDLARAGNRADFVALAGALGVAVEAQEALWVWTRARLGLRA